MKKIVYFLQWYDYSLKMRTKQEQIKSGRRLLYLWFPYLSIERHKRIENKKREKHNNLSGMIIVQDQTGRRVVVASCSLASQIGVMLGRSLEDALAVCPNLSIFEIDLIADQMTIEALADWCGRYTPLVAVDRENTVIGDAGIWLDITGCAHLFGGEVALLNDIIKRLTEMSWTAFGAISDTPGSAWAVAHCNKGVSQVIAPGEQQAALSELPLSALRLPTDTVDDLSKVGLRKISELISVPIAPLRARFGKNVRLRLNQALGIEKESVSPQTLHSPYLARLVLTDPVSTSESIKQIFSHLLSQVIEMLVMRSLGIRQLRLNLYKIDGRIQDLKIRTSQVSQNSAIVLRLFSEKIDNCLLDTGVDVVTLEATETDVIQHKQVYLNNESETLQLRLPELIDSLTNRFGVSSVTLHSLKESYCPERSETKWNAVSNLEIPRTSGKVQRPLDCFLAVRPLRLVDTPERLDSILLCKRGRPKNFGWRHNNIQIRRVNGPERISPEWWCMENYHLTRDYFRVEDIHGCRYWLFKEFLKKNSETSHWYLHGFFA